MNLRVGQVLVETYRIERLIAEGGMGSVYEASHVRVPKRFAVKFLNMSLVEKTEAIIRFRREAEIIATLDHPNIVTLFDHNVTEEGVPYMVLEYLDGEHLGRRLSRGRVELKEAIRIAVPVAHALSAAHKRNVVHRDLKPENIILCKGNVVKVVDFGIAKIRGHDLTGTNSIIGTVPYMAPEQIASTTVDGRTDEFALASILYEMLSGEMAFGGPQSVPEVAMRVMHHMPPFIADIPQAVNDVVFRAMAKKAADRYPTMTALLDALLEAASRPDEVSSVIIDTSGLDDDDDEGLPPLAGEATSITHIHVDPSAGRADHTPLVTPSEGLPPLTAMQTAITARPSLVPLDAPLGSANGKADDTSDKTPTTAPSSDDGGYAPLESAETAITRIAPTADAAPAASAPPPAAPVTPPVADPLATAPTGAMPIIADVRPVLPVRLIHELATRNLPQVPDRSGSPVEAAPPAAPAAVADNMRSTATISRDSLQPGGAPSSNRAVTSPSLSIALPGADHTTDMVTPGEQAPRRGPLVWLGVAAAAASLTVLIGLIVRHFLH